MRNKIAIVVLLISLFYVYRSRTNIKWGPTVTTNSGSIRGTVSVTRDGREIYTWLQIPYAQPPLRNLRFSTPLPVKKWEGVRDGHVHGKMCPQVDFTTSLIGGDEDCLFLNVHAPKVESKRPLPVLVFIHGGAFVLGFAQMGDPTYILDHDVILVSIQYRLGALGFMTTGDKNIRGNMGMKDQALALKWIKENIHHFGGDPNQVTIFGQSAGGASVHYLTLSPSTRGLFSKAFSNSGNAISPWSFSHPQTALERTQNLARDVDCPIDDTAEMTECLRGIDASVLMGAYRKDALKWTLTHPSKDGVLFVPTVELVDDEETFLAQYPYDVLTEGKAHKIPWMSSIAKDEGLLGSLEFRRNPEAFANFERDWDKSMQTNLYLTPALSPDQALSVGAKVKEFYFKNGLNIEVEEKHAKYTELISDEMFLVGQSEAASVQRQYSPVYLYFYNKTGAGMMDMFGSVYAEMQERYHPVIELTLVLSKLMWRTYVMGVPLKHYGIVHAQDGIMYFPILFQIGKDDPNYQFSKDMVNLLVSFATSANGAPLDFKGVKFTPNKMEKGPLRYLKVDDEPQMIKEPFAHRTAFWHSINYSHLFSKRK